MAKNKKIEKEQAKIKAQQENDAQVVEMKFSEDKFYHDMTVAHFEKGKVYEVRGADQIMRWLKRGGVIVKGTLEFPEQVENPSVLVENSEQSEKLEVDTDKESGDSLPKDSEESELEVELDAE